MSQDESAVNQSAEVETSATESAPVETETTQSSGDDIMDAFIENKGTGDDYNQPEDDSKESDESEQPEEETPESDEPEQPDESSEAKPLSKGEQRKQQLNSEIRDLVAQRNALRSEVSRINQEFYKVPSVEELQEQVNPDTGEYYNSLEAKLAVMEQQQQIRDYNEQIAEAQLSISTEAQRALSDFPMFDSQSPEYNEGLAAQADAILANSIVYDQNTGQIIGTRISPYQLYKSFSDMYSSGKQSGQVQGQKDVQKMRSQADVLSGASAPKKKTDPIIDALLGD